MPPTDWPETTYTPMPGLPPLTVPAWTGCLGLEPTPEMFVAHSVAVFREVWRLLRPNGTLWLNYGDAFATQGARTAVSGIKVKDLIGMPWRVAFALQADGWYLRMDNVWSKPNPMPESIKDRPTKAHEYVFLLSKTERYYYDADAIKEPGVQSEWRTELNCGDNTGDELHDTLKAIGRKRIKSHSFAREVKASPPPGQPQQHRPDREDIEYNGMRNKRSVWTVATQPFPEAHFATFPEKLIEPCILAGAPPGGYVLDPFGGSGTTRKVALENNRECTIIEIGPQYVEIAQRRTAIIQQQLF
ncbi:site-specific DNA-methyltransferase [Paenibacillus graminis]|nr:site-specific DNA-methyltransferase [Paenibacillus graminis]